MIPHQRALRNSALKKMAVVRACVKLNKFCVMSGYFVLSQCKLNYPKFLKTLDLTSQDFTVYKNHKFCAFFWTVNYFVPLPVQNSLIIIPSLGVRPRGGCYIRCSVRSGDFTLL